MHLQKWHGDRKVPALTSCDVFGTQTLRLPHDDPKKCEQTELAPPPKPAMLKTSYKSTIIIHLALIL